MYEIEELIFAKRTALLYDQDIIERVAEEVFTKGLTINQGCIEEELWMKSSE
jgi:hypothetical protein